MSPRLAVSLRAASVRRGDRWVLRGITWQIKPGERWALLGENGAGKTQLLKLLSGDIWPTPTRATSAVRTYRAGRHAVDLPDAKQRIAYLGGERQVAGKQKIGGECRYPRQRFVGAKAVAPREPLDRRGRGDRRGDGVGAAA